MDIIAVAKAAVGTLTSSYALNCKNMSTGTAGAPSADRQPDPDVLALQLLAVEASTRQPRTGDIEAASQGVASQVLLSQVWFHAAHVCPVLLYIMRANQSALLYYSEEHYEPGV